MTDTLGARDQTLVGLHAPHRGGSRVDGDPLVRLHLTADDLAKVRVRPGGGPFVEAIFGLRLLRARRPNALAAAWVRQVRPVLEPTRPPLAVLSLVELLVDLHALALQAPSIGDGLRRLATGRTEPLPSTDPRLVWVDSAAASVQSWLHDLRKGDRGAAGLLVRLFHDYYQRAVDPYWRPVRSRLEAERSRRGHVVAEGGVDQLLATLHPNVRWRPPVLQVSGEVEGTPPQRGGPVLDVDDQGQPTCVLGGRSLVLVPSAFCLDRPRLLWSRRDPSLPLVLVYPALRSLDDAAPLWARTTAPDRSTLAKLLGRTQAAVLAAIADTCTTTGLAHRVGISVPTASHHAGILRNAGLVVSRRSGNTVVHRLTPLGADLLAQA